MERWTKRETDNTKQIQRERERERERVTLVKSSYRNVGTTLVFFLIRVSIPNAKVSHKYVTSK